MKRILTKMKRSLTKVLNVKKIGLVALIQIILILCMIASLPMFVIYKVNLDILAIIIAIMALIITLLNEVSKAIEAHRKTYVIRFNATRYNLNLGKLLEEKVNNLREQDKKIDTIKVIDDKNRPECSEVVIVYH